MRKGKQYIKLGETRACEICGKPKYYQRTYLKRRNPRTCSRSHAAILKHREGWIPTPKRFQYSKKNMTSYRAEALRIYGTICALCRYDKDVRMLDVDHKDNNHNNNAIENLQVLCVWCHALITRGVMLRINASVVE